MKLLAEHESLPWNPLIARTFYRRGIIKEWGRGTLRMAEMSISADLPAPEIEEGSGCVTVRFRHGDPVPPRRGRSGLAERQAKVLALLDHEEGKLTRYEIRDRLDTILSDRQVRRVLEELKDSGLVVSAGRGPSARWKLSV